MKKILVICAGGMSSSYLVNLLGKYLQEMDPELLCDFAGVYEGVQKIEDNQYDLYLETPQIGHFHDHLEKAASLSNAKLIKIPPLDYVPVPKKMKQLSELIMREVTENE